MSPHLPVTLKLTLGYIAGNSRGHVSNDKEMSTLVFCYSALVGRLSYSSEQGH